MTTVETLAIAPQLLADFEDLNVDQQKVVIDHDGPMLVLAGPGSGKTHCLVLRALNLLLLGKAKPSELLLCTFTKKATFEMQDRIVEVAKKVGYEGDILQMRVGTIHSICDQLILENLHHIPSSPKNRGFIGNNYETLNSLTQRLFIFEHLDKICRTSDNQSTLSFFLNMWESQGEIVRKFQKYFDKITEELINIDRLAKQQDDYFLPNIAYAYKNYRQLLAHKNRVDFSHLLKAAYGLLNIPAL